MTDDISPRLGQQKVKRCDSLPDPSGNHSTYACTSFLDPRCVYSTSMIPNVPVSYRTLRWEKQGVASMKVEGRASHLLALASTLDEWRGNVAHGRPRREKASDSLAAVPCLPAVHENIRKVGLTARGCDVAREWRIVKNHERSRRHERQTIDTLH